MKRARNTKGTVIVIAIVAILLLWGVAIYNRLVRLRALVKEGFSGITVQLRRRADLVPNLVSTVEGYAAHEKGVFEEVTAARAGVAAATKGGSVEDKAKAEARLDQAIVNVLAVAEAYPELKASANFMQLQEQLADTENQLAFARQYYNDAAATLNKLVATVPWMFFAGMAGVRRRDFYEAPADHEAPPTVTF